MAPPEAASVTFERLIRGRSESHKWMTYYGAYDGWRYSLLDQITRDNVKKLRPDALFVVALL